MLLTMLPWIFTASLAMLARAQQTFSAPRLLTQFPVQVRIENLVALPSSTLVICDAVNAALYSLDALAPSPVPTLLHKLTNSSSIFGIANPTPSTIAVTASDFSFNISSSAPGTNKVYLLTLNNKGSVSNIQTFPVPAAAWLNGITSVPGKPHLLLMADCELGTVIRLDTSTGAVVQVASDPLFLQDNPSLPIGINGVHAHPSGYLYFTNSIQMLYGRLAINHEGLAVGTPAEKVASSPEGSFFDDFALANDGTAFAAALGEHNGIDKITPQGASSMVAEWNSSSTISQVSSAAFGRTAKDQGVLYFATTGEYVSTGAMTGGQVFALDPVEDC